MAIPNKMRKDNPSRNPMTRRRPITDESMMIRI
jgi:hypothetical protein